MKKLCGRDCTWDDPVPEELSMDWLNWKTELSDLSTLSLPRRYGPSMPPNDSTTRYELHHFSDASMLGYGACSYLRIIQDDTVVSCDLVMSKSKVTPKKTITVPRLELAAAVLATELSEFLERELDIPDLQHHFWCDSRVVLGYIRNSTRRFHAYVANRVQAITNDYQLVNNHLWWHGPLFLTLSADLPLVDNEEVIDQQDPEVKKAATLMTKSSPTMEYATLQDRLQRFSTWFAAKRAVAICLRYIRRLRVLQKTT